jgi:DNA-binding winged helix-turn-helix (wHTH) protein
MSEEPDTLYSDQVTVQPNCYCVDDLLIEIGRRRVSRAGHEIRLGRLAFDLLVVLIKGAPEVIPTAELMNQLWPGSSVGRETVTQCVIALRTALGDDAKTTRYIANVRGRGYRMVANVHAFVKADRITGPARLRAVLRST